MQFKARKIGGDTWLVEEFEVQNLPVVVEPEVTDPETGEITTPAVTKIQPVEVVTKHSKVAVTAGGTAQDAIDTLAELTAPPSADEVAAQESAARKEAIRNATKSRIFTVVDELAQMNLAAAAASGLLTASQMKTYKAGVAWVGGMRAAYADIIADPTVDFAAESAWPDVPAGVAELAALF